MNRNVFVRFLPARFRTPAIATCLVAAVAAAGVRLDAGNTQPAAVPLLAPLPSGPATTALDQPATPETHRQRLMLVNLRALDAPRLSMDLFPDVRVETEQRGAPHAGAGMRTWSGRVPGDPLSSVVLVARDGLLQGGIRLSGAAYSIEPLGTTGTHVVREMNLQALPPELVPLSADERLARLPAAPQAAASLDDGNTIDVLAVYTATARNAAGSDTAVTARIALGIAETNLAFENSGSAPRLRLVGAELVGYDETGDLAYDLERLTATTDGFMDIVHARRAATGADLVTLIVGSPFANACGVAWMMQTLSPSFAPLAFSVTAYNCISPNYSFGHELAHNMGSAHAPEDLNIPPVFPYSYGYKHPEDTFRTIMAYDCPSGCPRVLHFSNPGVPYNGAPTGTAERHHNVRSIDETRLTVANFALSRDPVPLLGSPEDVTVGGAGSTVTLAWTPPATGTPSAYVVEVGSAEGRADVAMLTAGLATELIVPDVRPGVYFVRVRAVDAWGPGAPSDSRRVVMTSQGRCDAPVTAPALLTPHVDGSTVTLTWAHTSDGGVPTSYLVGVGRMPGTLDVAVIDTGSTEPHYQTAAANGTYYVRVAGRNACGVGAPSNMVTVTVASPVPGPPPGLGASVGAARRVTLTWGAPSLGAAPASYVVEAGSASGQSDVATIPTGGAARTLTVTAAPGTYYVRVRGVTGAGPGPASGEIVVHVP